jgi:hypothetical protein
MNHKNLIGAAVLASVAGLASAQPMIDGIYDDAMEADFYGPIRWVNTVPTQFGDNTAGLFNGGTFGDPENVTTGIEIRIPKSALGGASSFRIAGWVTSGDRGFMSNQIVGSLPIDTPNIGGAPDFSDEVAFPGSQFIDAGSIATATITVDGSADAGYGAAKFTQTNYTGFGDNGDATDIGGGGSEIDQVFVAQDATNFYIMVAGNIENNGNGLELYIDVDGDSNGPATLSGGNGSGAFITNSGVTFDAGVSDAFRPDYVISVDSFDDDEDGMTPNVPRAFYGAWDAIPEDWNIDLAGALAGHGAANAGALSGGDAGVPAISLAVDNNNIAGVIGNPSQSTPVSPDDNWAYGSELNNLRGQVVQTEIGENLLYVFIGGNMEVNYNKFNIFFDVAPGGQNTIGEDAAGDPVTNIDISFGALQNLAGLTFDADFTPDYWINTNNGVDGGSGELLYFADCAVIRTDGALVDPISEFQLDYGSYFGGGIEDGVGNPLPGASEVLDFSGPRIDLPGSPSLFAEYAPRQSQLDPFNPIPGLLLVALDNSNVGGVTSDTAIDTLVRQVSTGIEICVDLDELGWDGSQDIKIAGFISNSGFNFLSNQVIGDAPGPDNLGAPADVDFSMIAGNQFVNLSDDVEMGCNLADLAEPFGVLDLADITTFIAAFTTANPVADIAPPFGVFDLADITAFVSEFTAGCP